MVTGFGRGCRCRGPGHDVAPIAALALQGTALEVVQVRILMGSAVVAVLASMLGRVVLRFEAAR
jgi:hypothetical protein